MSPADQDPTLAARHLPRSIQPDRDLWPEIEARLTAERTASNSQPGAAAPGWRGPGMARAGIAAGLLAACAVLWVASGMPTGARNDGTGPSQRPGGHPAGTVQVRLGAPADLLESRAALIAPLYGQLAGLPPETRTVVVANLNVINQALDEIDRALQEAPDSSLNRRLLMSMYADQLTMLTDMSGLIRRVNHETAQETAL